jgi:dihydrofolate reductase
VTGPVTDHLGAIRAAAGDKDVWLVGGGDLVGQFHEAGALDELMLSVAAVTLGAGAPLLPRRIESSTLRLVEVERAGQFAALRYEIAR